MQTSMTIALFSQREFATRKVLVREASAETKSHAVTFVSQQMSPWAGFQTNKLIHGDANNAIVFSV